MADATNTQGGHSIQNTGQEKTDKNPATTRAGSNSPRVPADSGPTAVSGGTSKTPS